MRSGAGKSLAPSCRTVDTTRIFAHCGRLSNAGTIGRVGYVGADFFLGPHFGGFREAMESPLILDMAIHTFDQARFITGADPVSVYCQEFNPPGSWYAGNASAICIYEMSDGSVFCYRGSWCAEGAPTSWEAAWRVTGEQGTALWDGSGAPYAEIVAAGDQDGKFIREYTSVDAERELVWPQRPCRLLGRDVRGVGRRPPRGDGLPRQYQEHGDGAWRAGQREAWPEGRSAKVLELRQSKTELQKAYNRSMVIVLDVRSLVQARGYPCDQ